MIMVDELRRWPGARRPFDRGSCHLTTTGQVAELLRFASKLGLRPEWYQPRSTPHFDLTPARRRLALELGAVFVPAMEQARRRLREARR